MRAWVVVPKATASTGREDQRPIMIVLYRKERNDRVSMILYLNRPAHRLLEEKHAAAFDIVQAGGEWGIRPGREGSYKFTRRLSHYGINQLIGAIKPGSYLMDDSGDGVLRAVYDSEWVSREEKRRRKAATSP